MAARATWKGFLTISRVTIPIKAFPATESAEKISFNQLHESCSTRMTTKKWCPHCDREVPSAEIVKAYEHEPGQYVPVQDAELDALAPPSTRVIDLTAFADEIYLDPLYVDRSYYLAPDGPRAAEAFVVVREAMVGLVGIGKLCIYGREYLVAVRQHQFTLMLHTLHHAAEIRTCDVVEDLGEALTTKPDPDQVHVARQVLAALHGPLRLDKFTDAYHADVRRLIDAKIAGQEILVPQVAETPAVLSLREALTQSLLAVSGKKTPAKVAPTNPRRRAARAVR